MQFVDPDFNQMTTVHGLVMVLVRNARHGWPGQLDDPADDWCAGYGAAGDEQLVLILPFASAS